LSSRTTVSPLFVPKQKFQPQPTVSPCVWTIPDLDAALLSAELSDAAEGVGKGFARLLFDRSRTRPEYMSPAALNYELPRDRAPEVGFVGRSNVGKSTLVGTLLGDMSMVRVSKEPGRTRSMLYFALRDSKQTQQPGTPAMCYLVDFPGYGFAKASKKEQKTWEEHLVGYLGTRTQDVLRRTFMLVDCRHGLTKTDMSLIGVLDKLAAPYQIVLTKTDLCSQAEIHKSVTQVLKTAADRERKACLPIVVTVSAKEKTGLDELKWFVAQAAVPHVV
jgi:GTP-binding protein